MKRRIYNVIPGERISDKTIVASIDELLASVEFSEWAEVDEDVYSLDFFVKNEYFYVMYLDPAGIVERLFKTRQKDIVGFMKERISSVYGNGVDIAICTLEIDNAVVCNHDGQVFVLKGSKT